MSFRLTLSLARSRKLARQGFALVTQLSYLVWPGQPSLPRLDSTNAQTFAVGNNCMQVVPTPDIDEFYREMLPKISIDGKLYVLVHLWDGQLHTFCYTDFNTTPFTASHKTMIEGAASLCLKLKHYLDARINADITPE